MTEIYSIKIEGFEGPLDLLLNFVKDQKVSIYEVSISEIAQEYLDYIKRMKVLDIEVAGNFIVMAAEMTRIKSRSLLPKREIEDENEIDPEEELRERLIQYQKIKQAAEYLDVLGEEFEGTHFRNVSRELKQEFKEEDSPGIFETEVTLFELAMAFQKFVQKKKPKKYKVIIEEYSVEDIMDNLLRTLQGKEFISFSLFVRKVSNSMELVASFLAILELLKFQKIKVVQQENFKDILIIAR